MSLTNLFNKDFFFQNLKKSKGLIIFISLLLPIYTLLTLSSFNLGGDPIEFWQLSIHNLIYMYIVPVVLSMALFDFVYKKTSADFICSMPLSRKTIFTTNTIGGIVILVLIQLATLLASFAFSAFSSSSILFSAMIWDAFLFFTISYIFVFIVTNLAVSFSGNKFSTIVSVLLILFLIPFILVVGKVTDSNNLNIYRDDYVTENGTLIYYDFYNFTGPSLLFDISASGDTNFGYNTKSMIKMVILSIIYFGLGVVLFNRKRFEMAEDSYESEQMHLIMKFLTLTPFISFLTATKLYEESIALLFFIAVLAVYYYVFDLITNKKMNIKKTLVSFIISSLAMTAFFMIIVPHLDFISKRKVEMADIKCIKIETVKIGGQYDNDFGLEIEDKDLIEKLLNDTEDYEEYIYSSYLSNTRCSLVVKTTDGKDHNISKHIGNLMGVILQKYGNEQFTLKNSECVAELDHVKLPKATEKEILNSLKQDLEGITYSDYYRTLKKDVHPYALTISSYRNHKLIVSDFSGNFKTVAPKCIEIVNERAIRNASKVNSWDIVRQDGLGEFIKKNNPDLNYYPEDYKDEKYYLYKNGIAYDEDVVIPETFAYTSDDPYAYERTIDGIIQDGNRYMSEEDKASFVKGHNQDFDLNKPYIVLKGYNPETTFYSNDIEGFYRLLAKAYNQSEMSKELGIVLNENI